MKVEPGSPQATAADDGQVRTLEEAFARWQAELLGTLFYLGSRIDALASRMDARFDTLTARMDSRFDSVDARLDAVNARVDTHLDRHAG